MNVRKKWKPGGRQRGQTLSAQGPEKRKKDCGDEQYERPEIVPPLVPRKARKEG
ncbi:MAG: hypothetical protein PWQ06_2545 [Anaerophaga sp.]|nr:hypothetical protein [Eubacteriaceae bacterium]MDN5292306.1 hypothetical protein [Anaerophaga sp.]